MLSEGNRATSVFPTFRMYPRIETSDRRETWGYGMVNAIKQSCQNEKPCNDEVSCACRDGRE